MFLLFLLFPACNQEFDPRKELEPKLVVFSILSNDRKMQFARVEQDYMPSGFNPLEYTSDNTISKALVTLNDGGVSRLFMDTVLTRSDSSRYTSPVRCYVLTNFMPVLGRTYKISATSTLLGTASGSVTIPLRASLDMGAGALAMLDNPSAYAASGSIVCNAAIGLARGYHGHLYVDYDVLIENEWREGRVEIPLRYLHPTVKSLDFVVYPQVTPRPSVALITLGFTSEIYRATLSDVADRLYKGHKLVFKWAVFQMMQLDKNLYNYYSSVHSFRDAQSIRLDEPMFSNISGGYGLVGAYTLDSLVHLLPENFGYNNR